MRRSLKTSARNAANGTSPVLTLCLAIGENGLGIGASDRQWPFVMDTRHQAGILMVQVTDYEGVNHVQALGHSLSGPA